MKWNACAILVGVAAVAARGATLTITDYVDAAYASDGLLIQTYPNVSGIAFPGAGAGAIYEIPIYFQISNLQVGETGFGSLDLSVTSVGGVTLDNNVAPYAASTATYTSGKSLKAYYFANFAAPATITPDFQNIVASIPAGVMSGADATMGQSGPFLIGWIYADWYADAPGNNGNVDITVNAFNTNDNGVLTADTTGTTTGGGTIFFGFPEPATLSLAGMGGIALLVRRRRRI